MKKLLSMMLLISSTGMYAAANSLATLKNMTPDRLMIYTTYDGENGGWFQKNARTQGAIKREFGAHQSNKIDFDFIKYGSKKMGDNKPFSVFVGPKNKEKEASIKFASQQKNGQWYEILPNTWDKETDYIIISYDDLEEPEWQM